MELIWGVPSPFFLSVPHGECLREGGYRLLPGLFVFRFELDF